MQIYPVADAMSLEEQFRAAVKVIRSLPKNGSFQPSDEMKLTFYAYFKQATDGPNTTKKPAFYDIVNRYKWDVWKRLGDMDKHEAMRRYVDELKKVIETINMTSEVSSFLDILGPFYEFLPESPAKNNNNPMADKLSASKLQQEDCVSSTKVFTAYDSEGDEFTDPVDTTFYQDAVSIFGNPSMAGSLEGLNSMSSSGKPEVDERQTIPKAVASRIVPSSATVGSGESLTLSEQLTVAIFKLQASCDRLQSRVSALERRQQVSDQQLQTGSAQQNFILGMLFPELSTRTTILVLAWPIVAHFAINYIRALRKK